MSEGLQHYKPHKERVLIQIGGLVDSEGSIVLTKSNKKYIGRSLVIGIENKKLIKQLAKKLNKEFKIDAKTYRMRKKGDISKIKNRTIKYKEELWFLVINKKDDLKFLLPLLPLRNEEKIKKRELLLKTMEFTKWEDIKLMLRV